MPKWQRELSSCVHTRTSLGADDSETSIEESSKEVELRGITIGEYQECELRLGEQFENTELNLSIRYRSLARISH